MGLEKVIPTCLSNARHLYEEQITIGIQRGLCCRRGGKRQSGEAAERRHRGQERDAVRRHFTVGATVTLGMGLCREIP